ncbi:MAG: tyrosine--tRNA ligase [Actinobacteria bacterium BACL4 MAG-120820-bin23]|jgi:tyrosyl-tRNA synthetase|uniref:tyrosine--tRNA ligase n=1 Tax=Candidatus Nanopelagicus sp. TaxID=2518620 RepID=UPI0007133783|nr:MAG: tyrosine--tRNA ligase [Actinobacteria bacterium BACL4 MAG-120820-bin23]KRO50978.1 MAG: tyrosine--tRNA ligase [Actinobacteria bacterium BACL4 MAG-121001-bin59]KRO77059.1 MAG: tyrosine--tRNA ligase [Actinobacteria bacterium BACL4 MAG-120920-bin74]
MSDPLLEDLEWRGLIAQSTDRKELEQALAKPMSLYLGFDPTAPSLHVGNLVVLLVLRRFQLAGHRPIPLVGGATGLVGDPSGRSEERSLNDEQVVAEWVSKIKKQLEKIIDFSDKKTGAVMANNLDWTKPVSALEFLRDIGKHFSVNQMLAKDSVANRLATAGISYTEFSYQVLQAFDFLELYRRHDCKLQIGGSDQWGNIVAGLDLIRKVEGGAAHALTVPLLAKADGSKFGKTAGGSIWLDPQMTSAYEFFQYWLNSDDADMPKLLKVFSMKSRAEIERLIETVKTNPGAREAHRELARELTTMIHGEQMAQKVELAAKALFGHSDISELDLATLDSALAQLPRTQIAKGQPLPTWVDLLAATGVVDSKSAARRIVKEGGAYLNNQKVESEDFAPSKADLLHGKYLLLRKGKRDLAAVEVLG